MGSGQAETTGAMVSVGSRGTTVGRGWYPRLQRRGVERVFLLAWAAVLPVFTVLDLFFNFLLKHHYFTMVPVAVGGGALLASVAERGRWGRAVAAVALVTMAVLAGRVGLDAATGRIP